MERRVFLFTTQSGSEYLAVLTPAQELPGFFIVLLLVQLAGGTRRMEGGLTSKPPEIYRHFVAGFAGGRALQTSPVTDVREI